MLYMLWAPGEEEASKKKNQNGTGSSRPPIDAHSVVNIWSHFP